MTILPTNKEHEIIRDALAQFIDNVSEEPTENEKLAVERAEKLLEAMDLEFLKAVGV